MKLKNFNKLTSFGAADTVTGSCHLLEGDHYRVLIDAGLFQGADAKKHKNTLHFEATSIDAIFLTHAHLDHCGLLPYLCKKGFEGPIFCTQATRDLAEVILLDSASIMQYEAKKSSSSPLYRTQDVQRVMKLIKTVEYNKETSWKDTTFSLVPAGHIPGAASLSLDGLLFSGDLGRNDDLLLKGPEPTGGHHVLFVESTYGGKEHPLSQEDQSELISLIKRIKKSKGTLLIGAFSVARSQMLLFLLKSIMEKHPEYDLPIYMDSPMTLKVNGLYQKHKELLKEDISGLFSFAEPIAHTWEEDTRKKHTDNQASILISSSGMVSGGKILSHLAELAPFKENILYLPGYLSAGTLGRELATKPTSFKIEKEEIPLKCDVIQGRQYSSHADQEELLEWIKKGSEGVKNPLIFIGHGEASQKEALAQAIKENFGFNCVLLEQERPQSWPLEP